MDKPEWYAEIADAIWGVDNLYALNLDSEHVDEMVLRVLPSILSAQSQAYIDAARIAEEVRDDYQRRIESLPDNHYKTPYRLHSKHAADQVRAAILQRKEEIGR